MRIHPVNTIVDKCNVLVIIAHPDDEAFVSGTISLCAERGFKIALVCITNGEGGSQGPLDSRSHVPLGEIRRRELALSASMLGIGEICFLNYADVANPSSSNEGQWDQSSLVSCLDNSIRRGNPELILTHGPRGGYGHPAHRLVHGCVMEAAAEASFEGSIFSFCAQVKNAFISWHFDQPSDVLIDVRAFLKRRAASLSYHQTQIDYFVQPYFPRTIRKCCSAAFGYSFAFCEAGRKRIPIATPTRFFRKFSVEGLALQKKPVTGRPHFFLENFANVSQVQVSR